MALKKTKSTKKKEKRTFIKFKGKIAYAQLDKPIAFEGKGEPKYVVKVAPDAAELKRVKAEIVAFAKSKDVDVSDEAFGWPWSTYEETGEVSIQLKRNGELGRCITVDAKNKPVPAKVSIGRGSVINVSGALNVYEQQDGGVNIYLNAIQVLELTEGGYGSPFDEAEGYEAAAAEDTDEDDKSSEDDDDEAEVPF